MNVLSLCDGMSCGQLALNRIGIKPTNYYASEIDKHAIKVTQANFPNTIQLGDITTIDLDSLPVMDMIIAGTPCQGFSFAGKQLAFEDPRSKLFFVFVQILQYFKKKNPNLKFLLENVRMKKEYLDVITEYMGVEPIMINSALVSAQNRVRYYWTNIDGIGQPDDRGITWGDVREIGLNEFYYTEKGLRWLAHHSQRKSKTLDIWQNNEKAQMVEASHHKNYSSQRFFAICDLPTDEEAIASMRGRRINIRGQRDDYNKDIDPIQYVEFRYDGKSNCLSTVNKDNIVVPFTLPDRIPLSLFFFRYISPVECERLQTVPDNYTNHVSNTQRYKMLGNGWTIDVIVHIFSNLSFM